MDNLLLTLTCLIVGFFAGNVATMSLTHWLRAVMAAFGRGYSPSAGPFVPLTLRYPCFAAVRPSRPCLGVRRHAAHPCTRPARRVRGATPTRLPDLERSVHRSVATSLWQTPR